MMPPAHSAMVAWHTSGVRTFEDARRKEITAGASPKGSYVYTMAALLNEFLGAKFKIVAGYQGIASIYLALERGEVDSLAVTWGEFRVERANLVAEKKVLALVQSAPKADDLPDVPTVDELAKTDDDRGIIGFLLSGNKLGRPLAAPPGTPAERVAALRAAFEATMKDPRFLKDVDKRQGGVRPDPGRNAAACDRRDSEDPAAPGRTRQENPRIGGPRGHDRISRCSSARRAPARLAPAGSWDCQVHVFGDPQTYPPWPGRQYNAPPASFDDMRRMHGALGIARGLIVQPTTYGTDHTLLLDLLAAEKATSGGDHRRCDYGRRAAPLARGRRAQRALQFREIPRDGPDAGKLPALDRAHRRARLGRKNPRRRQRIRRARGTLPAAAAADRDRPHGTFLFQGRHDPAGDPAAP